MCTASLQELTSWIIELFWMSNVKYFEKLLYRNISSKYDFLLDISHHVTMFLNNCITLQSAFDHKITFPQVQIFLVTSKLKVCEGNSARFLNRLGC